MGGYAWVTLATNNSYSLGALVLAHSLKKANTAHSLAVLITPAVSESMREQLQTVFDVVKVVDVLDSKDEAHLALMKRPDLGITFTKIHCWRLVEFEKCVFLDADTLVVRNCDELFEREEFSAAPDVSWPDCFNSGVFVYRPSIETFNKLLQFAVENRSFDGGDQGLLNQYFSDWATEDIKKHLPFVYNLTSVAAYSYIPAFKHYGAETRIVHFIGTGKPWLQSVDVATRTVSPTSGSEHLTPLLQQWWNLFCEKVHPNLDKNLESSNKGMSHSPVEACSNPLPNALIDETQTPHLIEPCTPYREKDDFRQCNLPYQPFDVKGSSGELLNEEFLLASVVSPKALEVSLDEQQRQDEDEMKEKNKNDWREDQIIKDDEILECNTRINQKDCMTQEPKKLYEERKIEDEIRGLEQQQKQEDPPPSKDPFEYNSFFPDDICINNYLKKNVKTYQPFDNHHHHHHHKHLQLSQYQHLHERNNESDSSKDNQKVEESIISLPRFLTLPEDDRRQSGNIEIHPPKRDRQPENELPQENFPTEKHEHPSKEPILSRDDVQKEPITEKRELTKSKSMPFLPFDVTITQEPSPPPPRSIWKSQPDVTTDFNRKYSMPKLKPILPKNSFNKSIPSATSKVTQYTEFLMSSEYKDPIDLPKDKVGFVEMHIHKEAKLRRSKSDVDIRSKFGPLPYILSPEVKKQVIPKKTPFRDLENELYDLTQCKRQLGNKPKSEGDDQRKENIRIFPALKPIVPAKDMKSVTLKKRKSKKLSPEDAGREKIFKRDPEIKEVRERKRVIKFTPRNVSINTNRNDLDEILNRLREFSKNYQHFFGVVADTNKKTVKCKNVTVQANEQDDSECTSSEIFKTIRTPVSMSSKESQTGEEITCGLGVESLEFRQFRNYIKDQMEANQKGLLSLQEILSESVKKRREGLIFSSPWASVKEMGKNEDSLIEIINSTKEGNESSILVEKYNPLEVQYPFVYCSQEFSKHQSSSKSNENECNNSIRIKDSVLKHIESSACTDTNSNLRGSNSSSCGDKSVSLLYRAKDISLNISVLHESNEGKANGIIEKTVQSHSNPYNIISSSTCKIKKITKPNAIVSKCSEEQKKHQANVREEVNVLLNTKPSSKEHTKNLKEGFLKESTENQEIQNKEQALVIRSKECQSLNENGFLVAFPDTVAPENLTKLNSITDAELHQEDISSSDSQKQEREGQSCISDTSCNIKVPKSVIHSKNEEITHECLGSIFEQEDGKSAVADVLGEAKLSIRNNKQCENGSSRNLNPNAVSEAIASITSASTTPRKEQNHVMPSRNEKINELFTKEKGVKESIQEKDNQKIFSSITTKEKVEEYKKPDDILCASDLEISRRFRKTPSAAEVIASDLVEEMITETVCECDNQSRSPPTRSSSCSTPQKARKPRLSPKKISENSSENENRFNVPSKDSPDGTDRFIAKKTLDKKSERKALSPSAYTPRSGNAQSENLEDLNSASGIAGAIAQLNLESGNDQSLESTTASAAHQEYLRRQNWETGNMDYMGRDSFDNIWSKICQTIEAKESEESVAGSPKPPAKTSVITEEVEKFKEVVPAENTVSLSSIFQKCPEYIETLPGESAVGPVEDDEIIFSKPENKQSCLMNVAEEKEAEIEGSKSRAPLLAAENVKLSDILHPRLPSDEAENTHTESSDTCEKRQAIMTNVKELKKKQSQTEEEKAEKVLPCEESKNPPKTLPTLPKNTKSTADSAEGKSQFTVLPTEIKSELVAPERAECKTIAICQPPIPLPQTQPFDEQKQPETLVKTTKPEEKAEECKTVAIPSPPIVFPEAPVTEREKRQSKTEKVEKKPDVQSEPIPLPPPDSSQELDVKTSESDSLKDESKQKKGVFTKILEMVGVAPKEKNGSEISKSVFYDTEGSAFSKQIEIENQTSIMKESEEPEEQALTLKLEIAQSPGDARITEEVNKPKAKETEQEKAMPPAESHNVKEPFSSKLEERKSEIIPDSKEFRENQEIKLQELKHSNKNQVEKPPTKEPEKPSGIEVKSKNQSKKQKSGQAKPGRNSSPKELKTPADSAQASEAKRKSPSPKLTMPQIPPETEVTMPTPPPQPDVSPRRNSALLKVDDSILETPPVPGIPKESIDEVVKGEPSREVDIMEKAKSEVESLLQDCRSGETEVGENSDLINTMKLMMAEEQPTKTAKDDIEELRVTSEEERKQHKGEAVSSKLSDQILKAIPPPRRKAISEASASTSAIPKASTAPEQKNPPGESKIKTSKSSSIPVPPPRSRGKPTQPAPSKGKGKK